MEKSWNVSIRRTFKLPWQTHCYLIEAISDQDHVRTIMARRFLSFIQGLRSSKKEVLRNILRVIEYDTLSVTGGNLRKILIKTGQYDIRSLKPNDYKLKYKEVPDSEGYRVGFIKELINIQHSDMEVPGFDRDELQAILHHLCVS